MVHQAGSEPKPTPRHAVPRRPRLPAAPQPTLAGSSRFQEFRHKTLILNDIQNQTQPARGGPVERTIPVDYITLVG